MCVKSGRVMRLKIGLEAACSAVDDKPCQCSLHKQRQRLAVCNQPKKLREREKESTREKGGGPELRGGGWGWGGT